MGAGPKENDPPAPIRRQGPQSTESQASRIRNRKLTPVTSIVHGLQSR